MSTLIFRDFKGNETEANFEPGDTVMQVALDNMIDGILGECGGACSCATCHCYIEQKWQASFSAKGDAESAMLEAAIEPDERSRLGCQLHLTDDHDGIVIGLPKSQY